jgi:tRNA(fMet)-specific endonuclease VapC
VDRFLSPFTCHPFDEDVADVSAKLRAQLAESGTMIGPYDLQIAATAVVHDLILVTHNTSEFSRIATLRIQDWEV